MNTYGIAMSRALRAVGSDLPHWRVLMLAHLQGPISMGEISAAAGILLSTTTKVVQRLVRDRLVRITTRQDDARIKDVKATPAGRRVAESIRAVGSQIYREVTQDLTSAEIEALNRTLDRIQQRLRRPG
ncbi:MAG: MarR family winged helix-turn-helix transcriptional regulator [Dehalococcoidia bacterium]